MASNFILNVKNLDDKTINDIKIKLKTNAISFNDKNQILTVSKNSLSPAEVIDVLKKCHINAKAVEYNNMLVSLLHNSENGAKGIFRIFNSDIKSDSKNFSSENGEQRKKDKIDIGGYSGEKSSVSLIVDGLRPNEKYFVNLRRNGDLRNFYDNVGPVLESFGELGNFKTDSNGRGILKGKCGPLKIANLIGRSVCVENAQFCSKSVCGVISRSSGLGQNTKRICACDGKTIWDFDNSETSWTTKAAGVDNSAMEN